MTYQDGMEDELLGNIFAELRKRGTFGGFSEQRIQLVLEGIWNKVEYALNYSQKVACKLEQCSDSKGIQSMLNGDTFEYHFWGGRFHMLPQSYTFYYGLCLNNSL